MFLVSYHLPCMTLVPFYIIASLPTLCLIVERGFWGRAWRFLSRVWQDQPWAQCIPAYLTHRILSRFDCLLLVPLYGECVSASLSKQFPASLFSQCLLFSITFVCSPYIIWSHEGRDSFSEGPAASHPRKSRVTHVAKSRPCPVFVAPCREWPPHWLVRLWLFDLLCQC